MRIAVISSSVFKCPTPGYAGLEMIAWHCAKGLAARGHHVALIAPNGSTCPGAEVIHCGPGGQWSEQQAYDVYWKALPNFEAVIDHSWQKWSYILRQEGVLKAPVLGVMHAPINTMMESAPPVEKPCVVCISDDQRSHYEGLFNAPARTCRNGVDPDFYRAMTLPRTDRALFLARFSTIKGPDLAIDACKEAGVGLDLVGDTTITGEPDYLAKCQAMCDGERIRMVGPETRGGCVLRYSTAAFMVHANKRFREPFGLAPVEAMLCGLPVAAYDNGAMRETVLHGETGYLVGNEAEMIEAVKALAGGVSAAARLRCREWAMQFSVAKMAERYEQLCQEAIQTGGW